MSEKADNDEQQEPMVEKEGSTNENGASVSKDQTNPPEKLKLRNNNISIDRDIPLGTPTSRARRRGQGSNMIDSNKIEQLHKQNVHWKKRLQDFVGSKSFDITIIGLVIVYTFLVFILFALDNDENENNNDIKLVIKIVQYIEMGILGIFIIEILLRIIAAGFLEYFKDKWLFFDAIVIIASVVLLSLDFSLNNEQFSTISKILRGIFRFLRLFLVFRKVNQFKKIAITHSRFAKKTPVEAILEIMNDLKENVDESKYIQDINYAIEMISDNRLYEPIVVKGDLDAQNWIGTYADPKKNLRVKKEDKSNPDNQVTQMDKTSQQEIYQTIDLPQGLQEYFEKIDTLEFDVFKIHELGIAKGQELGHLLCYLMQRYDVCQKLRIDPQVLFDFGNRIADGYIDNPYHNRVHSFDVTQTVHFFVSSCDFLTVGDLSALDLCTMYVSAACHDYEHGGYNNVYLINTKQKLAIIYNDKSPLENHHVSQSFFIMREKGNKYNICQNFKSQDYKIFRSRMITMILATDMQNHFTDWNKLKGKLAAGNTHDPKDKDKLMCMESLLHAADVSNPVKPFRLYEQWADRVLNEFWNQGDSEREQDLAITYLCDRYTVNKSKSQVGFINFIVKPYYTTVMQFIPKLETFMENFETNIKNWNDQESKWDEHLEQLKQLKEAKEKEAQQTPENLAIKK